MQLHDNTILITGGASGIGRALSERLLQLNNTIIVCGRDKNKLKRLKDEHQNIHVIACDISDEIAVKRLAAEIEEWHPKLNFLINNAGILALWNIKGHTVNIETQKKEILTNFFGTLQVTQTLLPLLLNNRNAAILNVTSALAFAPLSAAPVYSAMKAALHSYSISLRQQLQDTSIKLFEVLPTAIDTDMSKEIDKIAGFEGNKNKMTVKNLVDIIQKGIENDTYEMRPGMANMLYFIQRFLPGVAQTMLNKQSQKIIAKLT